MDSADKATPLSLILDERLCSDTVLRVTRLASDVFLVCDIRWLNGVNLVETLSYPERYRRLTDLLDLFHSPDLTALLTYEEVPPSTPIRGWETYDDRPGTLGVFLPAEE